MMVVRASAVDTVNGDETYTLELQGSSSDTFASDIVKLANLELGHASQLGDQDVDGGTGVYHVPFTNDYGGTNYQYLRLQVVVAGTSPSVTFSSHLAITRR